jgi:hypothetical protein
MKLSAADQVWPLSLDFGQQLASLSNAPLTTVRTQ